MCIVHKNDIYKINTYCKTWKFIGKTFQKVSSSLYEMGQVLSAARSARINGNGNGGGGNRHGGNEGSRSKQDAPYR